MQQVLGYSAMKTGVAYLAVAGTAILWSGVAAQLVTRVGVKPVLVTGMTLLTAGLVFFTQVSVGGSYVADLLPGFLLIGVGLGFSFVPVSIAALAGVTSKDAGLASGLINTSQQIGGAVGLAILTTIATTHADNLLAEGEDPAHAFTSGYSLAFWAGAGFAVISIIATIFALKREDLAMDAGSEPAGAEAR
jgi:MFS family permease